MVSFRWQIMVFILMTPLFVSRPTIMAAWFVCATLCLVWLSRSSEGFETIMDYFPWNEVNVVHKRNKESTVVQCNVKNVMDVRPDYDVVRAYADEE